MQPLENGSLKVLQPSSELKDYLMWERRALIQCASADERMITELRSICDRLTSTPENIDSIDVISVLQSYATILSRNAEDRRMAFMHIVRDTERRYDILPPRRKRRKKHVILEE